MKQNCLLFLGFLIFLAACSGQTARPPLMTENIPMGDTIPELGNNIMVVYQDQKNQYWFGSWETGLYRFDGHTLINYTTKHGLYSNRIDDIKEDKYGNIFFSGMNPNSTVTKFDGVSFTQIHASPSDEWNLKANDVWLKNPYRADQKVYRFDGDRLHELTLPKPPHLNNPFEIYSIYKDRRGHLWFGTNPVGVCRYDGKSFDWITEEDVTEFRDEGANGVRSIAENTNGDLWFNTEFRYSIYDRVPLIGSKFYSRHKSIGGLDGKTDSDLDEYLSIIRDQDDHLWFVTYRDGVWKLNTSGEITHYPVQENSKNITLFSIYKDNYGDLWIGTHENGVYKFNGKNFEKFKLAKG